MSKLANRIKKTVSLMKFSMAGHMNEGDRHGMLHESKPIPVSIVRETWTKIDKNGNPGKSKVYYYINKPGTKTYTSIEDLLKENTHLLSDS